MLTHTTSDIWDHECELQSTVNAISCKAQEIVGYCLTLEVVTIQNYFLSIRAFHSRKSYIVFRTRGANGFRLRR